MTLFRSRYLRHLHASVGTCAHWNLHGLGSSVTVVCFNFLRLLVFFLVTVRALYLWVQWSFGLFVVFFLCSWRLTGRGLPVCSVCVLPRLYLCCWMHICWIHFCFLSLNWFSSFEHIVLDLLMDNLSRPSSHFCDNWSCNAGIYLCIAFLL